MLSAHSLASHLGVSACQCTMLELCYYCTSLDGYHIQEQWHLVMQHLVRELVPFSWMMSCAQEASMIS